MGYNAEVVFFKQGRPLISAQHIPRARGLDVEGPGTAETPTTSKFKKVLTSS